MAGYTVAGDLYYEIDGQLLEIKRQLRQHGGYPCDPRDLRDALQDIIEGRFADQKTELINRMFIPAACQLEAVQRWNSERGWGFTDEDFSNLGEPPVWPEDQLAAIILNVQLDTVQRTFEEAWALTVSQQPVAWRWEGIKADVEHLRPYPGCEHRRGLCWKIIDLGANQGKSSEDIQKAVKPEVLPHSAGLWVAALHPKWVQAMNRGDNIPCVDIPGYQVFLPGEQAWARVPGLYRSRGFRRVGLVARGADSRDPRWGVPVLRE